LNTDSKDNYRNGTKARAILDNLLDLLPTGVVLLPIPFKTKRPVKTGWQKLTVEDTRAPDYQDELERCIERGGNIGVLLGKASGQLCAIDADSDEGAQALIALNSWLENTLTSKGKRGCQFWMIIKGEYHRPGPLVWTDRTVTDENGKERPEDFGEWRADGNQSIVFGRHPEGCVYKLLNERKPVEIAYADIKWPSNVCFKTEYRKANESSAKVTGSTGEDTFSNWVRKFSGDLRTLDVKKLATLLGIAVTSEDSEKITFRCPNESKHTNQSGEKDCALFFPGTGERKYVSGGCFHHSCGLDSVTALLDYFEAQKPGCIDACCAAKFTGKGQPTEAESLAALKEGLSLIQPKANVIGRFPISFNGEDISYWPKETQEAANKGTLTGDMVMALNALITESIEKAIAEAKPRQVKAWEKHREKISVLFAKRAEQAEKEQAKREKREKLTQEAPDWDNPGHLYIPGSYARELSEVGKKLFGKLAETKKFFSRRTDMVVISPAGELEVIGDHSLRSIPEKYFEGVFAVNEEYPEGEPTLIARKANLSRDLCAGLLGSDELSMLPEIHIITACPVVYVNDAGEPDTHRDGYLECGGSGIFVTGGTSEEVPLDEAVALIESTQDDFLFPTPADRARAIAMMLTPALVQGGFIQDRVPGDFAEANDSQAGKGYRHNLIVEIYNDTAVLVTQRMGGTGSFEEFLGSALLKGRIFILLDNLRGKLDSPAIESFLTTPYGQAYQARGFRQSGEVKAGRNIIQASSNGLEGTRDISNRMCVVRIRKQPAGYVFKQYPEGDLLEHVKANQGKYLGAIHAVIKEWVRQGQQRTSEHRHDFRKWCQTLDWILTHIFNRPGFMDGHREIQSRVSTPMVAALRELAIALDLAKRLEGDFIASELIELAEEFNVNLVDAKTRDPEQQKKQLGRKLGALFRDSGKKLETGDSILVEEYEFVRMVEQVKQDNSKGYHDQKTYRFRKVPV
jgi:hypothetical protein